MYKMRFVHPSEKKKKKGSTQRALNAAFHACNNYAERSSITASCASLCMQSIPVQNDPRLRSLHNDLKKQINAGQLKIFCR